MKVSLAPAAQADLDDIWLHIAQDDPDAANGVISFLEGIFLSLLCMPGMGHRRPELWPNALCFVAFKGGWRSRFMVVYRESARGIEIARVFESHRQARRI